MITFAEARRVVEANDPGAKTADHGYESDTHWFPVIAPERIGGRMPAVSKRTGALTWVSGTTSEEYSTARLVGVRP